METYLLGVFVAFWVCLYNVVQSARALFSARTRNFRKIRLHYNCWLDEYGPTKHKAVWQALYFPVMLFVVPLLSWLVVLGAIIFFGMGIGFRLRMTGSEKDRWRKLGAKDLTWTEIIEVQEADLILRGKPGPASTGREEPGADPYLFVIGSSSWGRQIRVNPDLRTLTLYSHTPDYDSKFNSVEEYRFENDQLLVRTIDDWTKHYNDEKWHIRGGTVLEAEIRKQGEGFGLKSVEEELAKYGAEAQWHAVPDRYFRFRVMAMHPANFPFKTRRRLIEEELKRFEEQVWRATLDIKNFGCDVKQEGEVTEVYFGATFSDADRDRYFSTFSDQYWSKAGIESVEFRVHKSIRENLLKLIEEPAAA